MALTAGVHHVATKTADMDRLIRFYTEVVALGVLSVGFSDPDGVWGEVCLDRPGDLEDSKRTNWTRIPWPDPIEPG